MDPIATLAQKIQHFCRNANDAKQSKLVRITTEISPVDQTLWLQAQNSAQRIYWADRTKKMCVAGIGAAHTIQFTENFCYETLFSHMRQYLDDPDIRYYGSVRFHPWQVPDKDWRIFGACYFVVPQIEIVQTCQGYQLAINFMWSPETDRHQVQHELLAYLESVCFGFLMPQEYNVPEQEQRLDIPGYHGWHKIIAKAMENFQEQQFQKIVLARKSVLKFSQNIDALSVFHELLETAGNTYHFLVQPDERHVFLGATPEKLYSRTQQQIYSEAVAGTRVRGISPQQDKEIAEQLLHSDKDLHEHQLVVKYIDAALRGLCEQISVASSASLLKLHGLQHLWTQIQGTLQQNTSDAQLFSSLHPTAAVCGYPRDKVWQNIRYLEEFDRGLYAGPVGWVAKDSVEFAVAIRSGLIVDNTLSLFVGAGIVPQSDPHNEWLEIENKLGNFAKVLTQDEHIFR